MYLLLRNVTCLVHVWKLWENGSIMKLLSIYKCNRKKNMEYININSYYIMYNKLHTTSRQEIPNGPFPHTIFELMVTFNAHLSGDVYSAGLKNALRWTSVLRSWLYYTNQTHNNITLCTHCTSIRVKHLRYSSIIDFMLDYMWSTFHN